MRNYGITNNYNFKGVAINSRLDSLQAEFLKEKIKYLDSWNNKRIRIAKYYFESLSDVSSIVLPTYSKIAKPVWHIFPIRCLNKRNYLRIYLFNAGIRTAIHYQLPIHKTKTYKSNLKLPNSERNSRQLISLPMHPFLTKKNIDYISNVIKKFYEKKLQKN